MIEKYALFRVMEVLINENNLSLRDIAKKASVGVATSKLCLDYLESKDIVKKSKVGNSHLFIIKLDNPLARHIKITYMLSLINDSGLVQELINEYKVISSIVLYGSIARGDYDSKSDIDILIVSRKKISIKHLEAEKKFDREIKFLIYILTEWREKAEKDKVFYDRVIIDGIALYGEIPVVM